MADFPFIDENTYKLINELRKFFSTYKVDFHTFTIEKKGNQSFLNISISLKLPGV